MGRIISIFMLVFILTVLLGNAVLIFNELGFIGLFVYILIFVLIEKFCSKKR